MFKFLRHKEQKQFDTGILGTLYFNKIHGICSWNGILEFGTAGHKIELSIETKTNEAPPSNRILDLATFLSTYESLKVKLFTRIHNAYQQSQYTFPVEQAEKMYHFAGVTAKENGDFWIVLEAENISSVYNHFMRFTIRDGNIKWANIN